MRRATLLGAAAGVAAVCASGAAHAAHVGVYVGAGAPVAPVYYAQAPYYEPPPPPQYIQRGPDGEPEVVPGDDESAPPPYPPGAAPQYAPGGSAGYAPGTAPQYPPGAAPQYAPGAAAPAPGDEDDDAPQYQQGAAPQTVTPQASGNTWYFCDASRTYYPYVKDCPSGWRPVPAQPAQQ